MEISIISRSRIAKFSQDTGRSIAEAYEVTDLGFRMRVHLYYDLAKAARDSDALYMEIEKTENGLREMTEPPDRKLHYDKYFFINRAKDGSLGYRRNHAAIDEALSLCGYFLIAETDFTKTTAEILNIYRRRDVVEKCFGGLKNETDMERLRTHSDAATAGKLFCAFLALIVRSYMTNCLAEHMRQNGLTFKRILLEFDKVRCTAFPTGHSMRITAPLTKTQRELLELLRVGQRMEGSV